MIGPPAGDAPWEIQLDGRSQQGAPAFQQAQLQPAGPGGQGQPQDGRRRLAGTGFGTDQDDRRGAGLGGQLQAAQGCHVGVGQPQDDELAAAGIEGLAAGPAGVGGAFGLDHQKASEGDARRGQGRSVGQGRRRNADTPAPGRDALEDGQQQAELADAGMGQQQLGQGTYRPAATRKDCIEGRVAGGAPRVGRRGELVAPPDEVLKVEGGGGSLTCHGR